MAIWGPGSHRNPSTLGRNPKDVWIVRHPVNRIVVPANYRFKVSFRWLGSNHKTLTTATRWSATCWQPDMRPDLVVQSINVNRIPGDAAENQYVALIANAGLDRGEVIRRPVCAGGRR